MKSKLYTIEVSATTRTTVEISATEEQLDDKTWLLQKAKELAFGKILSDWRNYSRTALTWAEWEIGKITQSTKDTEETNNGI